MYILISSCNHNYRLIISSNLLIFFSGRYSIYINIITTKRYPYLSHFFILLHTHIYIYIYIYIYIVCSPTWEAVSHQPGQTSTRNLQRHGQLPVGYRSYESQTWPIKWNSFFQAPVVPTLLYGCTTWTLTKRIEKKLDGNYTKMLREILNKSRKQHPTKQQLYGHLPPITKTIKIRRTRHAGHS